MGRDVRDYDRVRADLGVVADAYRSEDASAGADVDVPTDLGDTLWLGSRSDGDLLEDEAVRADSGLWMDDNAVGMWEEQAESQLAVQWNFGAADRAPEEMGNRGPAGTDPCPGATACSSTLVATDRA